LRSPVPPALETVVAERAVSVPTDTAAPPSPAIVEEADSAAHGTLVPNTLGRLRIPAEAATAIAQERATLEQPITKDSTVSVTVPAGGSDLVGIVTDAATGERLFGVNVLVVGTTRGATTDLDGRYRILRVPPGTYELRASQVGYAQVEMKNRRRGPCEQPGDHRHPDRAPGSDHERTERQEHR
jgi:hypothetical protein